MDKKKLDFQSKDAEVIDIGLFRQERLAKVLQFPRNISQRKLLRDAFLSQRVAMGLSILSVVMICTFFNQFLTAQHAEMQASNRFVASTNSQEDMATQLKRLDASNGLLAAEKPSRLDQLIVGELAGNVHVEMDGNKIVQMDWDKGVKSIPSKDAAVKLMSEYKDQFANGEVVFSLNDDGSVRSISILK